MQQSLPRVAVIVLNWNNAPDTLACLESVAGLRYGNFETVVVDNGSTDGALEQLQEALPQGELLSLDSNLGYAGGNNQGIKLALARGAEYVFLLNNDTRVAPDMLDRLVEFAENRPEVGMAGPTVFCLDPPDRLFSAGCIIDWSRGRTRHRGTRRSRQLPGPERVDFLTGCGVLVRRRLIETVGVLDCDFFLNFEDVEWAVRADRQGFESWHVPAARMWHQVSATLGQDSARNTYYMTRNALLFFWRNATGAARWLSVGAIVFRTIRTVAAWTFKSRYVDDAYRLRRRANLLALRDFLLGRSGPMKDPSAALSRRDLESAKPRAA